ncbi:MAG: hypothetical protein COB54_04065 [Alphaproteobacteria bacterium]|nr:MAG: hypothetical protein COB54_04065 [Alphaproteobacteria bacterium]
MTYKALLITGQESETISTLARNLIPVGGLSLFARQMKQMFAIGVEELHVVTDWFIQDFEKEILKCSARPGKVFIHATKDAPLRLLDHNQAEDSWFLIEEAVVIDDRVIDYLAQHPSPTVVSLLGPHDFLASTTANAMPLQIDECGCYFGSIAKLSSGTLAANLRKLNSLDALPAALKAISRASDCVTVMLTDIPLYIPKRRREVDLVWFPVIRREDGDKGSDMLLEATEKATVDWPARYIHRHIENLLVKYICKTPLSSGHLTLTTAILGFFLIYLFINGYMLPALFGTYIVAILAGASDKLGQIKRHISKFTGYVPFLDRLVEYGWYFSIAGSLSTSHGAAPYVMAAALALFQVADHIQSRFFLRLTRFDICDTGSFDRKFQLIAGCRNTHIWALLPFALFDQWYSGLGFICASGIITFFVHQLRVVYHLKNIMIANRDTLTDTFKKARKI